MRTQITNEQIEKGLLNLRRMLYKRLTEKGFGTYASSHEILGILEEEMHEFREAVQGNSCGEQRKELLDVGVAAMFGYICALSDTLDWPKQEWDIVENGNFKQWEALTT